MSKKTNPIIFVNLKEENKMKDYTKWSTGSGKTIDIKDMATSHIINSINKIKTSQSGWKKDWLPYLEKELALRNLYVASVDPDKWIINDKEMMYFLQTSCDFQIIKGEDEIYPNYCGILNEAINKYLKHIFAIPQDIDKERFIRSMLEDISRISVNDFYKNYDEYKFENMFVKEWRLFIDLMLGRRNEK